MNRGLAIAALALTGLLAVSSIARASSISATPGTISDTIYQEDINQNSASSLPWFYLDMATATTTVNLVITQTGSWTVEATVAVTGWPSGADLPPATALELSPDGGIHWYQTDATIRSGYCSPPPCSEGFTVSYRLDLRALGDGASSGYGNYTFGISYQLTAPDGPSSAGVSAAIAANAVASIMIYSQPTVYDSTVDQPDLSSRYFGGSRGFARFTVRVYAISDYEVSARATIAGCSGSCQPDGLLQADVYDVSTDDERCIQDQWGWQALPISGLSAAIFTGCNTMSGTPYSAVRLALRLDLANLGDSSSAWSLTFQVTVTIVER
jgi:hypothetical protein